MKPKNLDFPGVNYPNCSRREAQRAGLVTGGLPLTRPAKVTRNKTFKECCSASNYHFEIGLFAVDVTLKITDPPFYSRFFHSEHLWEKIFLGPNASCGVVITQAGHCESRPRGPGALLGIVCRVNSIQNLPFSTKLCIILKNCISTHFKRAFTIRTATMLI